MHKRNRKFQDRVGLKYGKWTVLKFLRREKSSNSYWIWWLCQCECGTVREVRGHSLGNRSTSCGCSKHTPEFSQKTIDNHLTHGRSRTRLYFVWIAMKKRCNNPNDPAYKNYGGRGIRVCKRWETSFENFLADMGECPPGLTLERINNDKGYSPKNCRWDTRAAQIKNRRKPKNARNPTVSVH